MFNICENGRQQEWLDKIGKLADEFEKTAAYYDEHAQFPAEHIQKLRDSGYTALTVGKDYGGEGISLYDMLLFQERLAKGDGPTALSIGWHLSVMGNWRRETAGTGMCFHRFPMKH